MELLERLNRVNDVPVLSCHSEEFKSYGRILTDLDTEEISAYMREHTSIPENGNIYFASVEEMEKLPVYEQLKTKVYGGMPIEIGYCNGRNTTYNGFEYHKGSEINIAVTDFMLVLGHTWEIKDSTYRVEDAKVFFVPAGTVIEMYQTTLHLSPCRVTDEGFRDVVVLPKGTNTPLSEEEKAQLDRNDPEEKLLLQRNKWVLSHPEREPLMRQGAHPGLLGENKELKYQEN